MRGIRSSGQELLGRGRWPHYLGGMLTETLYVLALTAVALVVALIVEAIL